MKTQYVVKAAVVLGVIITGAVIGSGGFGGTDSTLAMPPMSTSVADASASIKGPDAKSSEEPEVIESDQKFVSDLEFLKGIFNELTDPNTTLERVDEIVKILNMLIETESSPAIDPLDFPTDPIPMENFEPSDLHYTELQQLHENWLEHWIEHEIDWSSVDNGFFQGNPDRDTP